MPVLAIKKCLIILILFSSRSYVLSFRNINNNYNIYSLSSSTIVTTALLGSPAIAGLKVSAKVSFCSSMLSLVIDTLNEILVM